MNVFRIIFNKLYENIFSLDLVSRSTTLFLSTILANLISLVGYILLTQVYSMEAVGEYFSLVAISLTISVFVHFGFAQAIPLMDEDDVKIGVSLLTGMSLVVLLLGIIASIFSKYLFFIFFAAAVTSFIPLIDAVLIREGLVKPIAIFRVLSPFLGFLFATISGLFINTEYGMLVGSYFLGMSIVVLILVRHAIWPKLTKINLNQLCLLRSSYSRFPKFIGPGLLLHTAAYNLPSIVGLHYFGGNVIASYNLAYKFVLAPMTILGQAVGQAYISKLSHAYRNKISMKEGLKLDAILFTIAGIVSLLIYTIFPLVAVIIFPDSHDEITTYGIALIPLVFSMLAIAPLSNLLQFTENQKKIFVMHLLSFLGSVLAFTLAIWRNDFLLGVLFFAWFIMLRYAWLYFEILMVRKRKC